MGEHKLPSKATMQARLTALRDKAIQRGDAKSAEALSTILDAPIVQEWPEGETTISYPAGKAPKGCGHGGNPSDVCSDCSFAPITAWTPERIAAWQAATARMMADAQDSVVGPEHDARCACIECDPFPC